MNWWPDSSTNERLQQKPFFAIIQNASKKCSLGVVRRERRWRCASWSITTDGTEGDSSIQNRMHRLWHRCGSKDRLQERLWPCVDELDEHLHPGRSWCWRLPSPHHTPPATLLYRPPVSPAEQEELSTSSMLPSADQRSTSSDLQQLAVPAATLSIAAWESVGLHSDDMADPSQLYQLSSAAISAVHLGCFCIEQCTDILPLVVSTALTGAATCPGLMKQAFGPPFLGPSSCKVSSAIPEKGLLSRPGSCQGSPLFRPQTPTTIYPEPPTCRPQARNFQLHPELVRITDEPIATGLASTEQVLR